MSNSDWYAQRLAQIRQGQSAPPTTHSAPQYPPVAPPAPGQLPAHLAPYAPPPQYQQTLPGGGPPQQQQAPPPQQFTSYDANTGAQTVDDGTIAALYNSAVATGGSTVVRNNSSQCPNCNGSNYFTIQEGGVFSKQTGGRVNAMQCADCGYPKVQAGSSNGALQGTRSSGPARAARQLPPDHRVSVTLPGGQQATFDPPTGSR